MNRKQLIAAVIVLLAAMFIAVEFLRAASATAVAGRVNACRALSANPPPAAVTGTEAPDFALADANGKTWSLKSLRGRPVLLNFWATWCPPCVEELPSMEELTRQLGDRAVVLAVSVDENWAVVKNFFARGTSMSVLLDPERAVAKRYGTEKFPETFLIDAQGKVRYHFVNKRDWHQTEALMCIESAR